MSEPCPTPWARPLTLALAAAVVVLAAVLVPFVPDAYRPWNFAAFGAVGLFVAARGGRFGLGGSFALALGSKLAFDLTQYAQKGFDPDYAPFWYVYLGLAAYPVLGGWLLRRTENPLKIGATALAGGLAFFLVTNFVSWARQDLPYAMTPAGLLESYVNGIPFLRGTLLGDLTFTAVLFGLHAVLVRAPAARAIPVRVEDGR
jgi:hypothetical protein